MCFPTPEAMQVNRMSGPGGIVSLVLDLPLEQVVQVIGRLEIFLLAESLGGVESLVCHPASMTHASVPRTEQEKMDISDGLVRFSVGIEDVSDLIADLQQALLDAQK